MGDRQQTLNLRQSLEGTVYENQNPLAREFVQLGQGVRPKRSGFLEPQDELFEGGRGIPGGALQRDRLAASRRASEEKEAARRPSVVHYGLDEQVIYNSAPHVEAQRDCPPAGIIPFVKSFGILRLERHGCVHMPQIPAQGGDEGRGGIGVCPEVRLHRQLGTAHARIQVAPHLGYGRVQAGHEGAE